MMLIDYSEIVAEDYLSDDYVAGFLKLCLEEEGFDVFLVALRDIAKVRGGMTWLAKTTGLRRESLYRSLSHGARPEFKTIYAVLKALNVTIDFAPAVNTRAEGTMAASR